MSTLPLALDYAVGDRLRLAVDGRIIDFLDAEVTRPNTPEERVRQHYARLLHLDYGYPKDLMALGAPIKIGSRSVAADIAIYDSPEAAQLRDQGSIHLIVETKAPDVKSGVDQLKSYIFATSAEGGVWINATDAPKYFHRVDVPKRQLRDWPNIPRYGEAWEGIGQHSKLNLRPPHDLVKTFKRCHNALYKVGIDSEDLAMDMVRIILAKYQDELSADDSCEFRVTPLELQSNKGRHRVAERIHTLFSQVRDENRDVFDAHEAISAGDREIATVVSELQEFRFLPNEESSEIYDIVGAAYEVYVGSHLKGDRGQYFTHRLIVRLMVRMVDPGETTVTFDPAMGSGGFLVATMRHVTQKIVGSNRSRRAKSTAIQRLHQRIFGVDKSPKLVKVARTNMILASDGHSGLIHGDSLEPPENLKREFLRRCGPGIPTVILTNPPFGATSEHRITADKEPEILAQFDVGHVWRQNTAGVLLPTETLSGEGVPPEYLFVERVIRWVAPGGKIGIVVPRGLLDNEKALPVRTLILRETILLAVVNCHDDTFKPHTGTKAAFLILEKKEYPGAHEDDYPIFMAISQAIGHNGVGDPIYKTNATGDLILIEGEPVLDQDSEEIYEAWERLNAGQESQSEYYFRIRRSGIASNLSLNPVRYLPRYAESRQRVLELGETQGWTTEQLGQIARVFGGSRLTRPYADKGVTHGPQIVRFFTGNAVTQTRGENVKYLDLAKAKPAQLRMIDNMYLDRGMILITRSGTVGRVVYATAYHDGAVGTEDLIRVVVEDPALRGYVFQFLCSTLGQHQLKASVYGAIVDHIEPPHVRGIHIPIPEDRETLERIGLPVIRSMELQELAYVDLEESRYDLEEAVGHYDRDALDAEIARARVAEIRDDPSRLIAGEELEDRLAELLR